ncbi:MAG: hypothetical protein JWQ48_3433, partial [Conexibacter sp.]|nr:hypothetical protein [Conexibacter sp.]
MLGRAHERQRPRPHRRAGGARGLRLLTQTISPALRGAALMPGAALAVHQLRYELAFGPHASKALTTQGHGYLSSLTPWIVLLATLAIGVSLGLLAHRWATAPTAVAGRARRNGRGGRSGRATTSAPRRPGLRVWLLAALALVAVYAGQELLEGLFATGHPSGLNGIFGDGGWWALPAALLVGGLLALALRGGAAVVAALRPARRLLSLRSAFAAFVALP